MVSILYLVERLTARAFTATYYSFINSSVVRNVERRRVIARTLVYDGLKMLDDFAREYRGYVSKAMDYVCEELHGPLYEAFEECEDFGG